MRFTNICYKGIEKELFTYKTFKTILKKDVNRESALQVCVSMLVFCLEAAKALTRLFSTATKVYLNDRMINNTRD